MALKFTGGKAQGTKAPDLQKTMDCAQAILNALRKAKQLQTENRNDPNLYRVVNFLSEAESSMGDFMM